MITNDPDVPKLQEARRRLAVQVEKGEVTPREANVVLGKVADGLIIERRNTDKRRLFGIRYGRKATLDEIAATGQD